MFRDELDDVFSYALGLIDEAIVKGDTAKNAIEPHLVLGRERGIELRSVKVIHGLKLKREINSPVEGAFMLDAVIRAISS